MLNKITAHVYIKSEIKEGKSEKGTVYHKIFCTSKSPVGTGYIPYNFTLWGNRFDGVLPLLQKDKPIYIEADLQEPKAYINEKGEAKVVMQGYATKIELLPRESKIETPSETSETSQILPTQEELPF